MERILQTLFAGLVFMTLLVQTNEDNNMLYYVTPNSHSNPDCAGNQPCITFKKFALYHDDQENLTLVFLEGYHTLTNPLFPARITYSVSNKYLTMVGISTEVIIHNTEISFLNIQELYIKTLILRNGNFRILMAQGTRQLSLSSVTLIDYVLDIEAAAQAQFNNCKFINGINPLIIRKSQVILSGNSNFFNNSNSALLSYSSTITLSGTVSFVNNSGIRGGAMTLYSSTIYLIDGLNVSFINNSALETGGAIHIEPDMTRNFCPECFYHIQDDYDKNITFYYSKNLAEFGGDNIYGTSLALCEYSKRYNDISTKFSSNNSMSSVSSDPTQVCLCNSDDRPQCNNAPHTLSSKSIHPGERFTVPAVVVGGDYGTTIGVVHTSFMSANSSPLPFLHTSQYSQWINNTRCTDLQYTVSSDHIGENYTMYLAVHFSKHLDVINQNNVQCDITITGYDYSVPTFINLTILPCPMGFRLSGESSRCDCHPLLLNNGANCRMNNGKSYFSWNSTLWMSINKISFTYAKYCPLNYCDPPGKLIELANNPTAQCAFNRAGRLCGGCKENYSLAIGSSHCIHCPNNNNLALLIFFAAAGVFLVLFINILNITLTQGLFDGLIFYTNIIWTYQSIFFPEQHNINPAIVFLRTFIAWLNLDFGIETCFVKGLTSYWKTWLQFVFPFYIWGIVGLMVLTAKHSRILTKIYGNRAVPVLATLFLLSYMKLLRTVTSIYMFSDLLQYPNRPTVTVWSVDGSVDYFGLPHALLLVAALIVKLFLCLPYTLTLLLHQLLQKVSHIRIFKWVTKLKPYFDAHFAPYKPAHRYWFGVLLIARGILLAIFSSSFATPKNTSLLLLLFIVLTLLLYMAIVQPYKNKIILIIQSSFLANILFLGMVVFYAETHDHKHTLQTTATGISIGVVFFQFCGIIIRNAIGLCHCTTSNADRRGYSAHLGDEHKMDKDFSANYRDSIFTDSM